MTNWHPSRIGASLTGAPAWSLELEPRHFTLQIGDKASLAAGSILIRHQKHAVGNLIPKGLLVVRPKSDVFTNRPNPAAEEVLRHWGIEMIVSDEDDPKTALTDLLQKLVT